MNDGPGRVLRTAIRERLARVKVENPLMRRLALLANGVRLRERNGVTEARFGGLEVEILDLDVFYIEHKDVFVHRIYEFRSDTNAPRIIDGGAHIGIASLYFKWAYPDAVVTAFEPDPRAVAVLLANLRRNGYDDVDVVRAALGDPAGGASTLVSDRDGSRLRADGGGDPVEVVDLLTYLDESIDFLKLNIEGAELQVLRRCEPSLRQVRELVIEYHGFEGEQQYLHELLAILERTGFRYRLHDFDVETNASTKPPFWRHAAATYFLLIHGRRC